MTDPIEPGTEAAEIEIDAELGSEGAEPELDDFDQWAAENGISGDDLPVSASDDDDDFDFDDEGEAPSAKASKADTKGDKEKADDDGKMEEGGGKEPKIWKLKVNGRDYEVDASDEGNLQKLVQRGLGAEEKFQAAAKLDKGVRERAQSFVQMLKHNPRAILSHPSIGLDLKAFAEDILYESTLQEINPKEYQRIQEQKELAELKQSQEEQQRQQNDQQRQQQEAYHRQQYDRMFTEALNAESLPKTDWTIARMAQYQKRALMKKVQVAPAQLAKLVKEDWKEAQRQFLAGVKDGDLVDVLGEKEVDRIRRANLAKLNLQKSPVRQTQSGTPKKQSNPPKQYKYNSLYDML